MDKRLLWLTENYPPQRGGMAQSCDRIINGLRKSGFTIEIIHFTNRGHSFRRKQQIQGGYTPVEYVDSDSHTINTAWNYCKNLGHFDYVVCFGGYLSMIAAPIFKLWASSRLMTFLRGNDFDTAIFSPKKREMLQYCLEQSNHVFSVTSDKLGKIEKWLPHVKAHFVPNGIDTLEWAPTESEGSYAKEWKEAHLGNRLCLGIIGQLKAKKGTAFLIESLKKTNLIDQIHLLLIGDVEDDLSTMLNENEISYSILPFQDRYELMKYYLCCDAVCIPSFYDGMPNVMLEAGALGIPIMASNVDGMKDLIDHLEDGILFEVGDLDACRKALYTFCEMSGEERIQLGSRLKEKIFNNYTVDHELEAYTKIID